MSRRLKAQSMGPFFSAEGKGRISLRFPGSKYFISGTTFQQEIHLISEEGDPHDDKRKQRLQILVGVLHS